MRAKDVPILEVFKLVRTQRWFAQKHLSSPDISVFDSLEFEVPKGTTCLWLLLRVEPGDKVYSVVLSECAGGGLALASPVHLLEYATRHKTVTTKQGGVISFDGSPSIYDASTAIPLDECNSSNSLFSGQLGENICIAKFYRKMDAGGMRELSTLSALHSTGLTPRLFGAIRYLAPDCPQGAEPEVLCLYLEPITGRRAYEPFQLAARMGLAALKAGMPLESVLADDAVMLPDECEKLGRLIAEFHGAASGHQAPGASLDLDDCIRDLQRRWEQLARFSRTSENAARLAEMAPVTLLKGLAARADREWPTIASSYSHGDLHLSHIIFEGGEGNGRIIDPAHGICDTNVADHSARDLLQICRGFECFIFDEVATDLASSNGQGRDAAAVILADPDNPEAAQWMRFAQSWSELVFEAVLVGYLSATPDPQANPITDPVWRGVFYLERLFHELEYNITYDRAFFLSADIASLGNFAPEAALLQPRPITTPTLASDKECETIKGDAHVLH